MEKKEWFATWFDSKYYHILYQNRDENEAKKFIDNIVNTLNIPEKSKVLDLACGKGRHAFMLNNHGLNVIGLDLSPESISSAQKNYGNTTLRFDTHDMREVYQHHQFDFIFNLFTSFGYFENQQDNLRVLKSIETMLHDNGIVVIDFMNANKAINNLIPEETKTLDGIDFHIKKSFDGEHIRKNIQFEDQCQQFDFTERVQALRKEDFKNLISATKLQIINIFGNYSLQPYDEATSDRLIIVAQKQCI